ncbi:hypothetical protein CAPTEDRAFT_137115 [Capitella teleta]|uniref:Ionotropic glutamate receptor L-glutamate and glycine-binding domain-containing protein n=1 Tax=Capitella teleta TaxID=283909 RepID=R7UQB7_CAPTE|nr:hypothetical protein CAPTEDRAFT_137115 [Capitella teleta]|eukprot:ELU06117.1 hypothetical protein CAPTEDRAFT_137115 [Capitella teleta]
MLDEEQNFIGFIPDLMQEISEIARFSYEFRLYSRYGAPVGKGGWNGMVKALIPNEDNNTEVDIAAADMTITHLRRTVVDFSHPFNDLGLTVLINHPNEYKYGTIRGGSVYTYLRSVSSGEEFDIIRKHLTSEEGLNGLVNTLDDGLKKVRSQNYALFMESMNANFQINKRPCDLMTVGEVFGKRSFGMAVPKGAEVLEELDKAILKLRENGRLERLENKWFIGEGQCWNATTAEDQLRRERGMDFNKPKKVDLRMFWGPFVLMLLGFVISSLVCAAEFFWHKRVSNSSASTPY